jgi:hypothetical protein
MIKLYKPYITEDCIDSVISVLRSCTLVQGENVKILMAGNLINSIAVRKYILSGLLIM